MQFNSDSDNQDLVSLINDYTGQDNTSFPLKQKTRFSNKALKTIWSWIFESYGGWTFDDTGNTSNFPISTTQLSADQEDYELPSEGITIRGVEVKDQDGNWHRLKPVNREEIRNIQAEKEFNDVSSLPLFYNLFGNSIFIYPAANYTQADSLRVEYDREMTNFASTDTSQTPGFYSQFHEAVAVGASRDFAISKGLENVQLLQELWLDYEKRIKSHYSKRYEERPAKINTLDMTKEAI